MIIPLSILDLAPIRPGPGRTGAEVADNGERHDPRREEQHSQGTQRVPHGDTAFELTATAT